MSPVLLELDEPELESEPLLLELLELLASPELLLPPVPSVPLSVSSAGPRHTPSLWHVASASQQLVSSAHHSAAVSVGTQLS